MKDVNYMKNTAIKSSQYIIHIWHELRMIAERIKCICEQRISILDSRSTD